MSACAASLINFCENCRVAHTRTPIYSETDPTQLVQSLYCCCLLLQVLLPMSTSSTLTTEPQCHWHQTPAPVYPVMTMGPGSGLSTLWKWPILSQVSVNCNRGPRSGPGGAQQNISVSSSKVGTRAAASRGLARLARLARHTTVFKVSHALSAEL